jgi:ubiquinone/menaquinone biosynthesis C-methylase UbiE
MGDTSETKSYVLTGPAAKYYDFINFFFGVGLVNRRHISLIRMNRGEHLLDVGCGTAAILEELYSKHGSEVSLCGIDASGEMLTVARSKVPAGAAILLENGRAADLPYPDETFDWVVSCLTTHHLPLGEKRAMIRECRRVLKPNGRLVISDFSKPRHILGEALGFIWRHHAYSGENMENVIVELVLESGFSVIDSNVQLGLIQHLTASKSAPSDGNSTRS